MDRSRAEKAAGNIGAYNLQLADAEGEPLRGERHRRVPRAFHRIPPQES